MFFQSHLQDDSRGAQDHRYLRHLQQAIWPPSRGNYSPIEFARYINQHYKAGRKGFKFVSKEEYVSFFKFSIVRNPWDRVFSWYRNVMRDKIHRSELGVPDDCGFNTFLSHHIDNWALAPQIEWLLDNSGNIGVDYIGRFETLPEAIDGICKILSLDNSGMPRQLDSGRSDYRTAYDNVGREIVATKYAEEIQFFDYRF